MRYTMVELFPLNGKDELIGKKHGIISYENKLLISTV